MDQYLEELYDTIEENEEQLRDKYKDGKNVYEIIKDDSTQVYFFNKNIKNKVEKLYLEKDENNNFSEEVKNNLEYFFKLRDKKIELITGSRGICNEIGVDYSNPLEKDDDIKKVNVLACLFMKSELEEKLE